MHLTVILLIFLSSHIRNGVKYNDLHYSSEHPVMNILSMQILISICGLVLTLLTDCNQIENCVPIRHSEQSPDFFIR